MEPINKSGYCLKVTRPDFYCMLKQFHDGDCGEVKQFPTDTGGRGPGISPGFRLGWTNQEVADMLSVKDDEIEQLRGEILKVESDCTDHRSTESEKVQRLRDASRALLDSIDGEDESLYLECVFQLEALATQPAEDQA